MSNIIVRDNNRVTVVTLDKSKTYQEIIDADFKEIPEVPKVAKVLDNPKNSSGSITHKYENLEYQYDGGKIVQKWFVGVIERIVDKFMK